MTTLPQVLDKSGIRKFLTSKNKDNVSSLIPERHAVGKRIFSGHPTDIHPERFVHPGICHVEVLVIQGLDHHKKLALRLFARHPAYKTNNSWHSFLRFSEL